MKKEKRRFLYSEIEGFCSSNSLKEVIHKDGDTIIKTKKGDLIYEGLSEHDFKNSHCSCINIFVSHYTVVANILKKIYGYASTVYVVFNN